MEAFALLCRTEGIIPAIESAHALAGAMKLGQELAARGDGGRGGDAPMLLVNLSGRGDKDVETASRWFGLGDREEVDPGPGLDTDQQPTEGAVSNDEAVAGQDAGEEL
jgi:tryptophan synthase beta chain